MPYFNIISRNQYLKLFTILKRFQLKVLTGIWVLTRRIGKPLVKIIKFVKTKSPFQERKIIGTREENMNLCFNLPKQNCKNKISQNEICAELCS